MYYFFLKLTKRDETKKNALLLTQKFRTSHKICRSSKKENFSAETIAKLPRRNSGDEVKKSPTFEPAPSFYKKN